jgi:hypothetical protein
MMQLSESRKMFKSAQFPETPADSLEGISRMGETKHFASPAITISGRALKKITNEGDCY